MGHPILDGSNRNILKAVNEQWVLFNVPLQRPMFIVNSGENPTFLVRQNMVLGQTPKHWIRTKPTDPSEPETMQYFL